MDRIARPRNRHRVMLRDACARSLRQQIDFVGEADRLFEIVGDQQNADPLALDQRDDVLHDAGAHDRIERGERLVHQDELRLHRQHLRERDALALAAAEVTGKAVAEARKIQPVEPGLRLGQRLAALHAVEGQAERDIVARRLPRQQRVVLEQDADLRAAQSPSRPCPRAAAATRSRRAAGSTCPSPKARRGSRTAVARRRGSRLRGPAPRHRKSSDRGRAAFSPRRSWCRAARTCSRRT